MLYYGQENACSASARNWGVAIGIYNNIAAGHRAYLGWQLILYK